MPFLRAQVKGAHGRQRDERTGAGRAARDHDLCHGAAERVGFGFGSANFALADPTSGSLPPIMPPAGSNGGCVLNFREENQQ